MVSEQVHYPMCGRYVHPDQAAIERAWHIGRQDGNPFTRRYNVLPTNQVPVLARDREAVALSLQSARWGLIPFWWKDAKLPRLNINARAEEAAGKPMWRHPWRHARCLIPAEGWYEWPETETTDPETGEIHGAGQPYFLRRGSGEPFCFGGLMSRWTQPGAQSSQLTCAILTRSPQGIAARVHDRMPVIIRREDFERWTDPDVADIEQVREMAAASGGEGIEAWPVRKLVNSRKNEGPELIARLG